MPRAKTNEDRTRLRRQAEKTIARKLSQLKRLVASLTLWQRRAAYYAAQEALTDEDRAAADLEKRRRAEDRRQRARPRQIVTG